MSKLTALSKANADHFNNHPTAHTVITVVYGIMAVASIVAIAKKVGASIKH